MTTAQVFETSVTVNRSPIQEYDHSDDQVQPTYEMASGFKPFTIKIFVNLFVYVFSGARGDRPEKYQ